MRHTFESAKQTRRSGFILLSVKCIFLEYSLCRRRMAPGTFQTKNATSCTPCEPNIQHASSETPLDMSRASSFEYIGSPLPTLLSTSFTSFDWTF